MWATPPRHLLLQQGSVHVWRASLALPAAAQRRCEDILSAGEKEQCRRYVRSTDRARCAAARGSLRIVLANYLHGDPRFLSLATGANGKPFLDSSMDAGIQFNVSHADDRALISVTRGIRVGIDIERIRKVRDMDSILDSFFSEQEQGYLRSRKSEERTRAFFVLWTRREAAAKAMGLDLFDFFARFALPPSDRDESGIRVALAQDAPDGTADWWIRDLSLSRGYAGALCVERENAEPSFWNLLIR
jgi:4'-phosphopantetheinyl transferase